ncbi:MAG: class I SAM-dependent methyltransferase [Bradymonadaceae bacterium]|nr:class I SAM-dependent methyltransferase [Lujinxingiaceae bacterium]
MFHPDGPSFFELARQALSSTTRGYDLLAPKFDHTPFRTPDELLLPLADAIGPADSIGSAIDLCCGTGAVMRVLRPLCTDRVVGIDLSTGMLEEAARRLEQAPGAATVVLEVQDALAMEYDQQFDVATSCGAFGHVLHDDQDNFAERVRNALVANGRFVFVTHPMPPLLSRAYLLSRAFNGAMHLRNALIDPPFVMFYMTFPLERAHEVLERHGFELDVRAPYAHTVYAPMRLVIATKRA